MTRPRTTLTPLEAYNNCAEYHYAASFHSQRDGVSVTYVLARQNFWDALPIVERLDTSRLRIVSLISDGVSSRHSEEIRSLCEDRKAAVIELAEKLEIAVDVLQGVRDEGE